MRRLELHAYGPGGDGGDSGACSAWLSRVGPLTRWLVLWVRGLEGRWGGGALKHWLALRARSPGG